jgi:hypothetical protein
MEGSVEAGDLRHLGRDRPDCPNGRQIVRLVQRRERHQLFEPANHGIVDRDGTAKDGAAMDDAMAYALERAFASDMACQPVVEGGKGMIVIPAIDWTIDEAVSPRIGRRQARLGAEALDLTMEIQAK